MPIAGIAMILTRPEGSNARFEARLPDDLRSRLHIIHSPLIEIVALPRTADTGQGAALFSSANGVRFAPKGAGQTAYCVGQRTTRAAQDAGWSAQMKGEDAETLVQSLIQEAPTESLTHYRGVHTRGKIAERLTRAGLTIQSEVVYDQKETALNAEAQIALSGPVPVIVPLFSPRTARLFVVQSDAKAPLFVAAMSDQVAQEASPLRPVAMQTAAAPTLDAMVNAVEKLSQNASAG